MDKWHKERGWSGIGYHYFIRKDGTIEGGRDVERIPSAQAGHNTGSIAICVHGLEKKEFTHMQRGALRALCLEINRLHGNGLRFRGHCEVAAKTCPVFDYRDWLDLDARGFMQSSI